VNILGGFKFPNAPAVHVNPIPLKPEKQKFSPEQQKRFAESIAQAFRCTNSLPAVNSMVVSSGIA
jgi:hypothetical protein